MTSTYTQLVAGSGLSQSHALVLAAVPAGASVLDVGCASGYLGARLKDQGCEVTGLELDPGDAAAARDAGLAVIEGDIESAAVRAQLNGRWDAILFADVLEHLRDPPEVLAFVRPRLNPGGRVIVSLPNIAHWTGRRAVLRGRFPYADHGLFDRTHLRFYTRQSAHALARDAGFAVAGERFTEAPLPLESRLRPAAAEGQTPPSNGLGALRRWAVARRPELFALQFVLTLAPDGAPDAR